MGAPATRVRSGPGPVVRVARAWRSFAPEQRMAALAAIGLLVSMFLPWYEKKVTAVGRGRLLSATDNLSAFQAFSFVEAAVFLVAAGVLVLLFARAERRAFHLPGGDGTVIFVAGLWAGLLFFWRLFDKPSAGGGPQITATIGIQWGFLVAFVAAGALAFAGWRVRAAARPEPPLPAAADATPAPDGAPAPDAPQPPATRPARSPAAHPGEVPEPADPPAAPDRLF